MRQKYLVAWDFVKKRSETLYPVLVDEFGTSHPSGADEPIQRSVALCRDDFIASRLAALAEYFSATVGCVAVGREVLNAKDREEPRAFVERVLNRRLHQ